MTDQGVKITIVGVGAVGSATAFALAQSGLARKIVLQDLDLVRTNAEALDIMHGSLFFPAVDVIATSDPADSKNSDVIVITAGAKQKPGQSRIELAGATVNIMKAVIPPLVEASPNAIFLIVANPVDVVTFAAGQLVAEITKQPHAEVAKRIFGSGTVLDSSRLRTLLAEKTGVSPKNIHAYIAGEHGDSEIPLWSSATIGNTPLLDFAEFDGCPPLSRDLRDQIHQQVVSAAYKVIEGKGATNYAIALATLDILTNIVRDERRIMPVSSLITGVKGLEDVCMSLPFTVGRSGIRNLVMPTLSRDELIGLTNSATVLRNAITSACK